MIDKKYYNLILEDLGEKFNYKLKDWWDYYVIIVDNIWIYRFPKEAKKLIDLEQEKKVLDIIKDYIKIQIPQFEIIWWIWFKYKIIEWETMEDLNFSNLNDDLLENIINQIVIFLKGIHSIPVSEFKFLEADSVDYNIYRDNFKNEMDTRLKWKVNEDKIKKLKKYIDDLFALDFIEKVLVHTDVQQKNIIFDYDKNIIIKYLWFYDESFVKTVKFLNKKPLIFEIMNDDIYENDFDYLVKKIYLVTWNPWKVESFNKILRKKNFLNIDIEILNWDYPEIKEDWTTMQVVLEWSKYCSDKYNKDVLVQDTGLFINSLNWFPGVNTKFCLNRIWNEWILKLMDWITDRKAEWIFSMWYCEVWRKSIEFTWVLKWTISEKCRWKLWFWFDEIFIPEWHELTFGEDIELRDNLSPFNWTIDKLLEYLN